MQTKSLYERLGGYDAIAAVTDDLLARLLGDPQLGVFWKGHSENSLRRDRQLVVNYMCEAAGALSSTRAATCRPPTKAWASAPVTGRSLCGMPLPRWRNVPCRPLSETKC